MISACILWEIGLLIFYLNETYYEYKHGQPTNNLTHSNRQFNLMGNQNYEILRKSCNESRIQVSNQSVTIQLKYFGLSLHELQFYF